MPYDDLTTQIVLSPHFDDAVFSLGGMLMEHGERTKIVTVCGGVPASGREPSGWDLRCGFVDAHEAARTRATEDRSASAVIGATAVHLPFVDHPYSGRKNVQEVADSIAPLITKAVLVWAPAGIGGHPDHVTVRDAALLLLRSLRADVRLYADAPYASARGWHVRDEERDAAFRWEPQLSAARDQGCELSEVHTRDLEPAFAARKIEVARRYASQLCPLGCHYPNLTHLSGDLATEAYWDCRPS